MISVIVPVYNAEKWLNKCLDSLVDQTVFDQMEVILINDGSKDNSGLIIEEYVDRYENIQAKHIDNGGVSNARNIGLDLCKGEFIAFVDSDDYLDRDFIENLYQTMEDGIDITCSGFIAEYPGKSVRRGVDAVHTFEGEEIIREFLIAGKLEPNVFDKLFRREVIGKKRFNTRLAIAEDKYFLFQCLKDAKVIRLIPKANYHYVMNDESVCRKEFSAKNFHGAYVVDRINKEIKEKYPQFSGLAESMGVDVKCRIYGDMYRYHVQKLYPKEYKSFRRDIHRFSILKKMKNSNKKHTLALIAAKISPALYTILKHDLKLQYK